MKIKNISISMFDDYIVRCVGAHTSLDEEGDFTEHTHDYTMVLDGCKLITSIASKLEDTELIAFTVKANICHFEYFNSHTGEGGDETIEILKEREVH